MRTAEHRRDRVRLLRVLALRQPLLDPAQPGRRSADRTSACAGGAALGRGAARASARAESPSAPTERSGCCAHAGLASVAGVVDVLVQDDVRVASRAWPCPVAVARGCATPSGEPPGQRVVTRPRCSPEDAVAEDGDAPDVSRRQPGVVVDACRGLR